MRTTLDIEAPILKGLKSLQKKEKRSLSQLASELLTEALAARGAARSVTPLRLAWQARPMGDRVDLADKDAVYRLLDQA